MKTLSAFFCCLLALVASAGGNEEDYAVRSIPAALLKNANAVKRAEEMVFEVTDGNKARLRHRVVYTILNELGDRWAVFGNGYDKLRSIESFEGTLYDNHGKKIKSLKKGDITDVSGTDDGSLADDVRYKWHSFFYKVYPYTVAYEVVVRFKGTMFIPDWKPIPKSLISVQQSKLTVKCPAGNPLRYKMFNYKGEPVITVDKNDKIYTWEIKDMPAVTSEYAAPSWHEITPTVFLATEHFMLEDYEGSNANWKDFGKFVYDLKKDRDVLPDDIKQKVHQLTDNITDVNEKIKKLYEFMQQNTRYVSVQLGVGGWQPFDAKYVSTKKYGDCKALSNFMYSLLKEAGIRSVYTVTTRGTGDDDYLLADFPSSQFNHVVLFVPLQKDTLWLECTSQTYMPGYVGGDNCNRYAVAVDENGGTLVRTPRYGKDENLQIRKVQAVLHDDATLAIRVNTQYCGRQQDEIHLMINNLSKDKVKEYLHEQLDFATYDISRFEYKEQHKNLPYIDESLDIAVSNYATITGKRLFIVPNVMTRSYRKLNRDTARKYDVRLSYEYIDRDTVEIQLPPGYQPEAIPQDVSVTSHFGKYNCSVKFADNKLYYYRSIESYSGRFPASEFNDLVQFWETVYKTDRNKVVLVRSEAAK